MDINRATSFLFSLFLFSLLLVACRSTRPVAKIGLIAPFEGLYRQSGYEALVAMRMAIAEEDLPQMDVLPLAMDDSGDGQKSQRTFRKMLVDPAVQAVIGPLTPHIAYNLVTRPPAVITLSRDPAIPGADPAVALWLTPFAVQPQGGFANLNTHPHGWAGMLAAAAGQVARMDHQKALALVGNLQGWPFQTLAQWREWAQMPVLFVTDPTQAPADTAFLWLGDAAAGAGFWLALQESQPESIFLLGPDVDPRIFVQRAGPGRAIRQLTWLTQEYGAWADQLPNPTPEMYRVYMATRQLLDRMAERPERSLPMWQVWSVQVNPDGALTVQSPILANP